MKRSTSRPRSLPATLAAMVTVLALVASGCSSFGGLGGYDVTVEFERTFNLFPGSPVRILGIEVGDVRELEVQPGDEYVTATLRLNSDIVLPEDVRAIIFTDSLLGERFVQLDPPYVAGPTFPENGHIDNDRTAVPAEFDEVLDALNRFAEGVENGQLPRLIDNLAEILDGNGENIGDTLDAAQAALAVLRDNDDELIALARELAEVNRTLNTRTSQIAEVITDFSALTRILADQRVPIDTALSSLATLSDEAGRLLVANRTLIEDDIAVVTRVGQTLNRNLDEVSLLLLGTAELFRHAERVLNRDHNWLPLTNNTDDLVDFVVDTIGRRLIHKCDQAGLPAELCDGLVASIIDAIPEVCIPDVVSCPQTAPDAAAGGVDVEGLIDDAVSDAVANDADLDESELRESLNDIFGVLIPGGER